MTLENKAMSTYTYVLKLWPVQLKSSFSFMDWIFLEAWEK